MRRSLLLTFILFSAFCLRATAQQFVLSGKITDQKNSTISFVSVYIKNSTYGTTANEEGNYQLKLKPGNYQVMFRFVGYKEKAITATIGAKNERLDVELTEDRFVLVRDKISKNETRNDAANDIMREVINKREYYLNEVKSYSSVEYIKGVKLITSSPKNLLAREMAKILKLDTNGRGIAYQSESLSTYSFEQPSKVKEVFIASQVAGQNPPFGYNKASDLQVNFYRNLFAIDDLSSHGFVSPVANHAFNYYNYRLLGTIVQDGKKIDKIQVIPKHIKALEFTGSIYIVEGDWRIYSVDLMLTKAENNLNFVDTLKISQQYIPIKDNVWLPLAFQYQYAGSVQGFKYHGYYLGIVNNYKPDTIFSKGYFTGEVLHVDTGANTRSQAYWSNSRPVPLTYREDRRFKTKDSLAALKEYTFYLDSVHHAANKLKPIPFLFHGYLTTNKAGSDSLLVNPLLQTVYYNTVEGYGVYLKARYSKTFADNSSYSLTPSIRYGFADKLWSPTMHAVYTYDQAHAGRFFLNFGADLLDLSNIGTRSLYFNTLSTLFSEQNFVKYYRSEFGDFGYQRELVNGLLWTANLSYADRSQVYNISNNHIFTYSDKHYTSNNPLAPITAPANDQSFLFPQNQALTFSTSLRITFDQQYITRPTSKVYLPSNYPVITVSYRKGINNILSSDVNYDFVSLEIEQDRIPMGLFGHSAFKIKAGEFINRQTVYFMDYNHFLGNQGTTSDPTYVGSFHFLPFYTYSTDDPFIEMHYQHNFAGAIFDNVPVLKNLKLEEIVGANYLSERKNPNYSEFYFGIKRLIYGADYGVSYMGNKKYLQGFRIFIGLK
ncbi:MAG: DUF5686 and carboxypeptidase regulatory-like domain-containing protein [Mucilaginibacter sp.]